jgi:hypothetical protein
VTVGISPVWEFFPSEKGLDFISVFVCVCRVPARHSGGWSSGHWGTCYDVQPPAEHAHRSRSHGHRPAPSTSAAVAATPSPRTRRPAKVGGRGILFLLITLLFLEWKFYLLPPALTIRKRFPSTKENLLV